MPEELLVECSWARLDPLVIGRAHESPSLRRFLAILVFIGGLAQVLVHVLKISSAVLDGEHST